MKKLITLFSAAALATTLGLAGCKKDEPAPTTDPAAKPADPAAADPAAKPADPAAAAAGATGLAECDAYAALVAKYVACDKAPKESRDAMQKGFDGMKAGWKDVASWKDDAKKAANDGCKTSAEGLKKSAEAQGCTL
jgi:hypothetical protein